MSLTDKEIEALCGAYTVRSGQNLSVTYTHHCYYCDACDNTASTFDYSFMSVAICKCGRTMQWLSNEQAVAKRVNMHKQGDGCAICDQIQSSEAKQNGKTAYHVALDPSAPNTDETFYVTSPFYGIPIKTHGNSRIDALANCGFTVWTESEWNTPKMKEIRKRMYGKAD